MNQFSNLGNAQSSGARPRTELKAGIDHILQSFNQLGAFEAWENFITNPKFTPAMRDKFKVLGNSVLDSTLIHLRALNDFFGPMNQRFPDGMHAIEYGYMSSAQPLLTNASKAAIHKRLAHLSWDRQKPFKGHFVHRYIADAFGKMVPFLQFLQSDFLVPGDAEYPRVQRSLNELAAVQVRLESDIARFNRNAPEVP